MSLALVNLLSRSWSLSIHNKAMITIRITAIVIKENKKVIRPRRSREMPTYQELVFLGIVRIQYDPDVISHPVAVIRPLRAVRLRELLEFG